MVVSGKKNTSVFAVLLAAGTSRRFGENNKLLVEIGAAPMVRVVAEQLLSSRVAGIIAVTGFEARRVRAALAGPDIQFVDNDAYADGMASSLRRGIAAVPEDAVGAMIALADMPGVTAALVNELLDAFEGEGYGKIVFPARTSGGQGNPVIWPRRFFPELQLLKGDTGAKGLISAAGRGAIGVPAGDAGALRDVDEPADLALWRG